jgi:secreted trypsin-like serine protease
MLKSLTGARRYAASIAVVVALTAIVATPAMAITDGELDGNGHPYVGLMVAQDANGNPLWRCSGTLMSSRIFLTAGHCTEAPAAHAEIWFDADVTNAAAHNYPFKGDVGGTTYTHPDYNPNAFYYRDMGVVVLDKAVKMKTYGKLPALNSLDALQPSAATKFTAVGYGRQESYPDAASWQNVALRIRMVAHPHLVQINTGFTGDFSMLLSNNANTGGTCFGDSGGPNFLGNSTTVAGITSFGLNSTCGGTGGVFRTDRSWSLNWLATFGI